MTPVERACQAYWEANRHHLAPTWLQTHPKQQEAVRAGMRAAIAALEEPSEAMCVAGAQAAWLTDEETDKTLAYCIYRAAIRAALEEKP